MTATAALTTDLQRQVLILEDDLRARLAANPVWEGEWKQEHQRATDKDRTAASWVIWRDDRIIQAAVAWILTTVFIRFCEDNALLRPVWITGPGARRQEALDAQLAFFRQHPDDTDREWLLNAVSYLSRLPATRALVEGHSALHLVSPSGNAVTRLLEFWRRRDDNGALVHDLTDPSLSTRFLGDLYQDLSQHAKDTYALLQTPVFVEEFILGRTMEPALADRSLEGFRLIDPACGSGHFLLGAFARLLDRWHKHAPDMETQARVQTALDAIHGVDLNPFAVAIARFRLTLGALQASNLQSLEQAPAFTLHLAVGDSLIHGPDRDALPGMEARSAFMPFTYTTEDSALLLSILEEGRYNVVVGNPPYITVKDKSLNQIYRSKYADVCKGTYALAVPFMRLFFTLAKSGQRSGWVGQITSNSFMKREFGTKLIEDFLANLDLRLVIDSEGAWIPGHNSDGTPTVIIVGRNQEPTGQTLRAVLSKGKRETRTYGNGGNGPYWSAIVSHIDDQFWEDNWITVTDLNRRDLAKHPWSLAGGGAIDLISKIESVPSRLSKHISPPIGRSIRAGADEAFIRPMNWRPHNHNLQRRLRPLLSGEDVRDWSGAPSMNIYYPYVYGTADRLDGGISKELWPYRTYLAGRGTFSGDMAAAGLAWWEYMQHTSSAYSTPMSIAFAEVATHNHFTLDRGGNVFKQTAPVIKLRQGAIENSYKALLGVLNSSTVCFWLRQMSKPKGGSANHLWLRTYQFNGMRISGCPMPEDFPLERGSILDDLAQDLTKVSSLTRADLVPTAAALAETRAAFERIHAQMIAVQEELDWEVYQLYGLVDDDVTYQADDPPSLGRGERAFEIAMARDMKDGAGEDSWFTHPEQPAAVLTEIPAHWPSAYKELVQRRLQLIATDPFIRLLEKPEYKRRWAQERWEKRQEQALRGWLLDRLEDRRFWFDPQGRPRPRSTAQLADEVGRDEDLASVLALWEGRPDVPVTQSLIRLVWEEAVPFLAAYRYKESGLRKREAWEQTWAMQRREDAGVRVGFISVPPKYISADFRKAIVLACAWEAGCAERAVHPLPRRRAGDRSDSAARLGGLGSCRAVAGVVGDHHRPGEGGLVGGSAGAAGGGAGGAAAVGGAMARRR